MPDAPQGSPQENPQGEADLQQVRTRLDFEKNGLRRAESLVVDRKAELRTMDQGGLFELLSSLLGTKAARRKALLASIADAEALVKERTALIARLEAELESMDADAKRARQQEDARRLAMAERLEIALRSDHGETERLRLITELAGKLDEEIGSLERSIRLTADVQEDLRSSQEQLVVALEMARKAAARRSHRRRQKLSLSLHLPSQAFAGVSEALDKARSDWELLETCLKDAGKLDVADEGEGPSPFTQSLIPLRANLARMSAPEASDFSGLLATGEPESVRCLSMRLSETMIRLEALANTLRADRLEREEQRKESRDAQERLTETILGK